MFAFCTLKSLYTSSFTTFNYMLGLAVWALFLQLIVDKPLFHPILPYFTGGFKRPYFPLTHIF